MRSPLPILVVAAFLAVPAHADLPLDSLLRRLPADSLVLPLRRLENDALRPAQGAAAAITLGQLHYARGEYRRAGEAFSRAAARLDPARKTEARYWAALSWLALGDAAQARAGFEELVTLDSPRRTDAQLGLALAWEAAKRPERAFDVLEPLARSATGEAAPAILERTIVLADRFQRADVATAARQRLLKEFPRSIEAARAGLLPLRSVPAVVELGPFPTEPRAHAVADAARRAGFPRIQPLIRTVNGTRLYLVRLEGFADPDQARRAADKAKRELAVPAHVVSQP